MALLLHSPISPPSLSSFPCSPLGLSKPLSFQISTQILRNRSLRSQRPKPIPRRPLSATISAALPRLDLTEENIRQVLIDARTEFAQIFDASVGITGEVDLADMDGPFVKLRLKGRFWHKRATVLARLGSYLKNRIPEILEVDIEEEKQLDDSPENF